MSNLLYDTLFGCHVENDKPFLTYYDGSQISYDAFLRMASRFANVIKAAGLAAGRGLTVATANGMTAAYSTVIDELRLGHIVERDVRATIVPRLGDIEVLLGMSFLKRLDFAQRGDTLRLQSRRKPTPDSFNVQ